MQVLWETFEENVHKITRHRHDLLPVCESGKSRAKWMTYRQAAICKVDGCKRYGETIQDLRKHLRTVHNLGATEYKELLVSRSSSDEEGGFDVDLARRGRERVRGRNGARRPRRSRGGRGASGSRGGRVGRRGLAVEPNGAVAAAIEDRNNQLQLRIAQLPEETLRQLLLQVCQRHPSYVFDILEAGTRTQQGGHHPAPTVDSPVWCVCSFCREMPTEVEKLCCGQVPTNCFSRLRDFDVIVLDELVLHVARMYRQDVLAVPNDNDLSRGNRHDAYRQFILWHHGRLGAGNRRVIPSCCVWKIRDKFPDTFGQYKGFVDGRLG